MASSQGDIIPAEHLWGDHGGTGGAADHPSSGVTADDEASRLTQSNPSRPTERQTHGEEVCRQPQGPPRPRCGNARPSLGQDAAWADDVAAERLADVERPRDPVATPREIGQPPGVATVDMPCRDIAPWAAGFHWCGRD